MEKRQIWMRVGVTLIGTKEEIEGILNDTEQSNDIFKSLMEKGSFVFDGDSYIPSSQIEEYNEDNDTAFDADGDLELSI